MRRAGAADVEKERLSGAAGLARQTGAPQYLVFVEIP